jgi:hypothetical protein
MSALELKIQHQKDSYRNHLGRNQSFIFLGWMLKIIELETLFLEIDDILNRICHCLQH